VAVQTLSDADILDHSRRAVSRPGWGWLPVLSVVSATGLFILALADNSGRTRAPWADVLFWLGLLVAFVPVALRTLSCQASRQESIALLLVLAITLHLQRVLQYPLGFAYNDELQSVRTAVDIAGSRHLFQPNPALPVGPTFPGLQILTSALSSVSHLQLFPAAIVVLGVIRLVLTLALFLLYEKVGGSTHLAAIAVLLYTGEPGFILGGGQFAYSSAGIPLALFVLYAIVSGTFPGDPLRHRESIRLVAVLGLGALTVTHHLTSYFLAGFLLLWFILMLCSRLTDSQARLDRVVLGMFVYLSVVMAALWLLLDSGNVVIRYLVSPAVETAQQLIRVLLGGGSARPLFQSTGPLQEVPPWERLVGLVSSGLVLIGQPLGLYQIWKQYRTNAFVLAMAAASLLYPLSLIVRFTPVGASIASRATEYSFFPLAFVLALAAMAAMSYVLRLGLGSASFLQQAWGVPAVMSSVASILFIGGIVIAAGQTWWHTPGPYIPSAGPRSVSSEGIYAATWAHSNLEPGHRIAGDLVNRLLMASYGGQWIVPAPTGSGDGRVDSLFFAPRLEATEEAILRQMRIRYVVIDNRFGTSLPASGYYFDGAEPDAYRHSTPINRQLLMKWDEAQGVSRLFDSGNIVIYDTGVPDG
jgi:hypothetical protein